MATAADFFRNGNCSSRKQGNSAHFTRPRTKTTKLNSPAFSMMGVPEHFVRPQNLMTTADALFEDAAISEMVQPEGKREPKIRRVGSKSVILSPVETNMALNKILNLLSLRGGGVPHSSTKITDYLYLGNMQNAMNLTEMKALGITHVFNMAGVETGLHPKYDRIVPENFVYREVRANDSADYDIAEHIHEAETFINKAKEEGGVVLVHCYAGINRSGFIVAAHLLLRGCSLMNIVRRLKTDRGSFLSNRSFQDALLGLALHRNLLV